jgi:hypothetical protein
MQLIRETGKIEDFFLNQKLPFAKNLEKELLTSI